MSVFDTPFDPEQEAALVTGAGNGIGRAIAQALIGEGVRTVFADLNDEEVAAAIASSARPELAVPWVGDLASSESCDALLAMRVQPSAVSLISCTARRRRDTKRITHSPCPTKPGNACAP